MAANSFRVRRQSQPVQKPLPIAQASKPSHHSGPTPSPAELNSPIVENATDAARRHERESRHRGLYSLVTDPGNSAGASQVSSILEHNYYYGKVDPFPASAVAVVIGTVTKGQSFLSSDRTLVYGDYYILISSILKQDTRANLSAGGQIVGWRPGGSVHFPSGHLTHFVTAGHGFPKVGAQYIFFLNKPDLDLPEYVIAVAYEIDNGVVHPLDDYEPEFDGSDLATFMSRVKDEIAGVGRVAAVSPCFSNRVSIAEV
jgi:hypothetical protein